MIDPVHHFPLASSSSDRDLPLPVDGTAAYTFIRTNHQLGFTRPASDLHSVVLVLLVRPRKSSEETAMQSGARDAVLLMGLKAVYDAEMAVTTWGPDPLFWYELPPSMLGEGAYRSSPTV